MATYTPPRTPGAPRQTPGRGTPPRRGTPPGRGTPAAAARQPAGPCRPAGRRPPRPARPGPKDPGTRPVRAPRHTRPLTGPGTKPATRPSARPAAARPGPPAPPAGAVHPAARRPARRGPGLSAGHQHHPRRGVVPDHQPAAAERQPGQAGAAALAAGCAGLLADPDRAGGRAVRHATEPGPAVHQPKDRQGRLGEGFQRRRGDQRPRVHPVTPPTRPAGHRRAAPLLAGDPPEPPACRPGGRPPGAPRSSSLFSSSRGDPSPRTPLGKDPAARTSLGRGSPPPRAPRAGPPPGRPGARGPVRSAERIPPPPPPRPPRQTAPAPPSHPARQLGPQARRRPARDHLRADPIRRAPGPATGPSGRPLPHAGLETAGPDDPPARGARQHHRGERGGARHDGGDLPGVRRPAADARGRPGAGRHQARLLPQPAGLSDPPPHPAPHLAAVRGAGQGRVRAGGQRDPGPEPTRHLADPELRQVLPGRRRHGQHHRLHRHEQPGP